MWLLLPRSLRILIVVGLGILGSTSISTLVGWLEGSSPPTYKYIATIATIISVICIPAFNAIWRWVWKKFPVLNRVVFPDLNGVWEGTLISTWINPETNLPLPPIPATVTIVQTLFDTSIAMKTGESHSHSTRCLLEADHTAGIFRIWYGYDNRPLSEVDYRSARHEGVAWLEVENSMDTNDTRLSGQYFTQRSTRGDIRLTKQPYAAGSSTVEGI